MLIRWFPLLPKIDPHSFANKDLPARVAVIKGGSAQQHSAGIAPSPRAATSRNTAGNATRRGHGLMKSLGRVGNFAKGQLGGASSLDRSRAHPVEGAAVAGGFVVVT